MKKGISLIVLVITILVMIIIAGAIIISLSNTDLIDRTEDAVEASNIAELRSAVALAFSNKFAEYTTLVQAADASVVGVSFKDYTDNYDDIRDDKTVKKLLTKVNANQSGNIYTIEGNADANKLGVYVQVEYGDNYPVESLRGTTAEVY